jgi:hypothetical protein
MLRELAKLRLGEDISTQRIESRTVCPVCGFPNARRMSLTDDTLLQDRCFPAPLPPCHQRNRRFFRSPPWSLLLSLDADNAIVDFFAFLRCIISSLGGTMVAKMDTVGTGGAAR